MLENHNQTSGLQIWQGASKFQSKITLARGGSADLGNKITGIPPAGSVRQEGSEYKADIQGDEGVTVDEGNKIDSRNVEAAEDDGLRS